MTPARRVLVRSIAMIGVCCAGLTGGIIGCDKAPPAEGDTCQSIADDYLAARLVAEECTVGAEHQCEVLTRTGFWCDCQEWANGNQSTLADLISRYHAAGCQMPCMGVCFALSPTSCVADATSSTGGRCKPDSLQFASNADSGGTMTVPVGDEIDISLATVGAGSYGTSPELSSTSVSVLEVTIPAEQNPGGLTRLYRLKAEAPGVVEVRIPFEPASGQPSRAPFVLTIVVN